MGVLKKSVIFSYFLTSVVFGQYNETWNSLDTRPLPSWYDGAKIGIFLHWGVYSVPSFSSEWFWNHWRGGDAKIIEFMKNNYKPDFSYQDFARDFTAEFFDPNQWAQLFKDAGARYVVLTSKHHEGYTLWPSKYSYSWNSVDVGPRRDLVGDLAAAVRNASLRFGVYHSLFEWYHPLYELDYSNSFNTSEFVDKKAMPELYELVNTYKPDILWSDGDAEVSSDYWQSKKFLAWLYNNSPVNETVVTNDRWGLDANCAHGDFYNCADRFNPGTLQKHKWENAFTLDRNSWGYRREADVADYLTIQELLKEVFSTVSCNGNVLINVGPTRDGKIAPIMQERLLSLGNWLAINGEAIYGSSPWTYQNDSLTPNAWYTYNNNAIYVSFLGWPQDHTLELKDVFEVFNRTSPPTDVTLLQRPDEILEWAIIANNTVQFTLQHHSSVINEAEAWVLRIRNQTNM